MCNIWKLKCIKKHKIINGGVGDKTIVRVPPEVLTTMVTAIVMQMVSRYDGVAMCNAMRLVTVPPTANCEVIGPISKTVRDTRKMSLTNMYSGTRFIAYNRLDLLLVFIAYKNSFILSLKI